jgi:hypothetical protein
VAQLCEVLNTSQLQTLALNTNSLGDEGAELLAQKLSGNRTLLVRWGGVAAVQCRAWRLGVQRSAMQYTAGPRTHGAAASPAVQGAACPRRRALLPDPPLTSPLLGSP